MVAVEPLPEMLAHLRREATAVRALAGSAETIPLPDGSADVVTAAQAFHWFDRARALLEVARVLRPGGALGLIWNVRDDSVDWMARLSELLGTERIDYGGKEVAVANGAAIPYVTHAFRALRRDGA